MQQKLSKMLVYENQYLPSGSVGEHSPEEPFIGYVKIFSKKSVPMVKIHIVI